MLGTKYEARLATVRPNSMAEPQCDECEQGLNFPTFRVEMPEALVLSKGSQSTVRVCRGVIREELRQRAPRCTGWHGRIVGCHWPGNLRRPPGRVSEFAEFEGVATRAGGGV